MAGWMIPAYTSIMPNPIWTGQVVELKSCSSGQLTPFNLLCRGGYCTFTDVCLESWKIDYLSIFAFRVVSHSCEQHRSSIGDCHIACYFYTVGSRIWTEVDQSQLKKVWLCFVAQTPKTPLFPGTESSVVLFHKQVKWKGQICAYVLVMYECVCSDHSKHTNVQHILFEYFPNSPQQRSLCSLSLADIFSSLIPKQFERLIPDCGVCP